jgi:hypothetical protein
MQLACIRKRESAGNILPWRRSATGGGIRLLQTPGHVFVDALGGQAGGVQDASPAGPARPDLCQQVIERLQALPPTPAAEPEPQRARVAPPGHHLLRGLSYLLAAAALVVGSTVSLPAAWLDRLTQRPSPLDLPTLLPTDPSSILLAVATLLLLLSIRTNPTPAPQHHHLQSRSR